MQHQFLSVTEQQGFLREKWVVNINRGIEGIFFFKEGLVWLCNTRKIKAVYTQGTLQVCRQAMNFPLIRGQQRGGGTGAERRYSVSIYTEQPSDNTGVTERMVTIFLDPPYQYL